MKCDICDQEFPNSEALKQHQERAHPIDEGDGEAPDMMDKPSTNPAMPETEDVPEPAERRSR
ncbi:MAG: hypothetical protein ACREOM_11400 [Candidatus Dormibacteraceae bacterium]